MRNTYGLVTVLLIVAGSLPASAWVPVDCEARMAEIATILGNKTPEQVRDGWASHLRTVREAKPGDTNYAPYPDPKTSKEVVEDFRYVYLQKLFDKGPDKNDAQEQAIYEGLQNGTLDLRVDRVENWSISRCDPAHEMPFFHLVRIFDRVGKELARATILHSGLMGEYAQITPAAIRGLVEPADLSSVVHGMLGRLLAARRVEFAAVDGLPLHCGRLTPCTVFKAEGSAWILDRAALLFEIKPEAHRVSVTQTRAQGWQAMQTALDPQAQKLALVSEGFSWAEASLVAKDDEVARLQGMKD